MLQTAIFRLYSDFVFQLNNMTHHCHKVPLNSLCDALNARFVCAHKMAVPENLMNVKEGYK